MVDPSLEMSPNPPIVVNRIDQDFIANRQYKIRYKVDLLQKSKQKYEEN